MSPSVRHQSVYLWTIDHLVSRFLHQLCCFCYLCSNLIYINFILLDFTHWYFLSLHSLCLHFIFYSVKHLVKNPIVIVVISFFASFWVRFQVSANLQASTCYHIFPQKKTPLMTWVKSRDSMIQVFACFCSSLWNHRQLSQAPWSVWFHQAEGVQEVAKLFDFANSLQ